MFRLSFTTTGLVPDEVYAEQARTNCKSGVPFIKLAEPHTRPLAVVGGGPSAARHLEELKEWPGDIWGVNQSAAWLSHAAPKANVWMFTVDPDPVLAEPIWTAGVQKALLGTCCSPKLVNFFRDAGKEVRLFNPHESPNADEVLSGGPSSVCRSFVPAMCLGYLSVTYFGCEGSIDGVWENGMFAPRTHAYRNETRPNQMVVKAGDELAVTTPDLYLSTLSLVKAINQYPLALKEKSGGLLRMMLDHPDTWEIVALSEKLKNTLDPTAVERYFPRAA